jgi:hypothetical protein
MAGWGTLRCTMAVMLQHTCMARGRAVLLAPPRTAGVKGVPLSQMVGHQRGNSQAAAGGQCPPRRLHRCNVGVGPEPWGRVLQGWEGDLQLTAAHSGAPGRAGRNAWAAVGARDVDERLAWLPVSAGRRVRGWWIWRKRG